MAPPLPAVARQLAPASVTRGVSLQSRAAAAPPSGAPAPSASDASPTPLPGPLATPTAGPPALVTARVSPPSNRHLGCRATPVPPQPLPGPLAGRIRSRHCEAGKKHERKKGARRPPSAGLSTAHGTPCRYDSGNSVGGGHSDGAGQRSVHPVGRARLRGNLNGDTCVGEIEATTPRPLPTPTSPAGGCRRWPGPNGSRCRRRAIGTRRGRHDPYGGGGGRKGMIQGLQPFS